MWGRGRLEGVRAAGPLPVNTRCFSAPACRVPRSPSSTQFDLWFPCLRWLRLQQGRLPRRRELSITSAPFFPLLRSREIWGVA